MSETKKEIRDHFNNAKVLLAEALITCQMTDKGKFEKQMSIIGSFRVMS